MLKIGKSGNAYKLLETVFLCGDFPTKYLDLFGNKQTLRNLIKRMSKYQNYVNTETREIICRLKLITVIGKQKQRTVRLSAAAKRIKGWFLPKGCSADIFITASGSARYIERRHRVAVGAVMFRNAGVEFREYRLPELQNENLAKVISDKPCFYTSDALKKVGDKSVNIIRYSRVIGAFYNGEEGYAVYNALNKPLIWQRFEELKAREYIAMISRFNGIEREVTKAILFGDSYETALKILTGYEKQGKKNLKIDGVYRKVYFIPINEFGYRMLKFFTVPDIEELINRGLFPEHSHTDFAFSRFDCINETECIISFLTGDIAKLKWFKEQTGYTVNADKRFIIVCFRAQVNFVKSFLNGKAEIRVARIEDVEKSLEILGEKK